MTPSKATSYRLPEETLRELARLAARWGCSQTKAVQRAIRIASGDDIPDTPNWQRLQKLALVTVAPGPNRRPDGTVIEWEQPVTTYQIQVGDRAMQVVVEEDLDHEMLDLVGAQIIDEVVPELEQAPP